MKTKALLFIMLACAPAPIWAKGPHMSHPIAWMHHLPTGELPGWSGPRWFSLDYSKSNVWNAPMELENRENGKTLLYQADYEQDSLVLEGGYEVHPNLSVALEIPYATRDGGGLDRFVDWVHRSFGANRFSRQQYPQDQSLFLVQTDGVNRLSSETASGIGNVKMKLKYWPVKMGAKNQCACGLGGGFQVKVPMAKSLDGLSSGGFDFSLLFHGALPLGTRSYLATTLGVTWAPENPAFRDWPRHTWLHLFEVESDIALSDNWGLLLQVRVESPFMNKDSLNLIDPTASRNAFLQHRLSSGYNSLVHWRVYETFGFRYRISPEKVAYLLASEDGGLGDVDETGDKLYSNNAPDILFSLRFEFTF
jgi:hypothetical protein